MLRYLTVLYCIVIAVYKSNKALVSRETNDDSQWLAFWVIFGLLELVEILLPFLRDNFIVYMSKFGLSIYLIHFNGAQILFDKFISPNFHYVQKLVEDKDYQQDLVKTLKSKLSDVKSGKFDFTQSFKKINKTNISPKIILPKSDNTPNVENSIFNNDNMKLTPKFDAPQLTSHTFQKEEDLVLPPVDQVAEVENIVEETPTAPLLDDIEENKQQETIGQKEESDELFSNVVTHVEEVKEIIADDVQEEEIWKSDSDEDFNKIEATEETEEMEEMIPKSPKKKIQRED
ncbi:Transmembrane domain-containing protein [Spironucleus salmonicida]|uniref:Transmembrane domain-containing protein n=1 Tax=Spironucleus salmonicida TaxID=348837 RepID=V6LR59_9EUKA|nr:Transmembrane domain-containing protein [Spironucleus salmonicida]|eukprot:EST47095.1 Transmembrane domain-containing protein [Spironucleus salmonicida]